MHRTDCVRDVTQAVRNKCSKQDQTGANSGGGSSSGVGNEDRIGHSQEQEEGDAADYEEDDEGGDDDEGRLAQKPAQRCEVCEGKYDGIGGDPHFCENTFKYVGKSNMFDKENGSLCLVCVGRCEIYIAKHECNSVEWLLYQSLEHNILSSAPYNAFCICLIF